MTLATRIAASVAALALAATGGALAASSSTAPTAVRHALAAQDNPIGAHGRTLGLSRVDIPAHAQLALHHHAGTQIAYIQAGTLTYTVKTGQVTIRTGAADANPRVVGHITAGHSGKIHAGQWIVEQPTEIHRAGNNTSKPVVILLATLFPIGSPPSIPNS
ncbi:MAG: Cupin 2 conserved barrel domain protein [Solirubrobacteraceae bacterium]|nr:Cupin 2 conserved barrel domain protein [Solirubrobacteraceae bacterium]